MLKILYDFICILTINLVIGQVHGLLFLLFPIGIWIKYGNSDNITISIIRYLVSMISCFNFELLNIYSALLDNVIDVRANNYWIQNKPMTTYYLSLSLQIVLSIIVHFLENDSYILLISVLISELTTYLYTIGRYSRNPTYKAVYAAYIGIGIHPSTVINLKNNWHVVNNILLMFSLPWMFIDPIQDVKDLNSDRRENRKTRYMIMVNNYNEDKARGILLITISLIQIYLTFLKANIFVSLLFFSCGMLLISRSIYILKYRDKLSWDVCCLAFIVWIFSSPNDLNFDSNITLVISLSVILLDIYIFNFI